MTSPPQAGLDTNPGDRLRKVLTVLGVVALAWLVLSSAIWIFTYNGSGAGLEQPGIISPRQPGGFGNTTPQPPGGFGNTTTPQQQGVVSNAPGPQQQPQGTYGQTYTNLGAGDVTP